jgi:hypothetical protein
MKITARGWNRDMGSKELTCIDLSELEIKTDESRTLWQHSPAMFLKRYYLGVEVHWVQELKMTGNYRVAVHLSRSDVLQLFKAVFGTRPSANLLEQGFVVSDELKKAVLRTIKLTDLTLGELAAMGSQPIEQLPTADHEPAIEKPAQETEPKRSFLRRV